MIGRETKQGSTANPEGRDEKARAVGMINDCSSAVLFACEKEKRRGKRCSVSGKRPAN